MSPAGLCRVKPVRRAEILMERGFGWASASISLDIVRTLSGHLMSAHVPVIGWAATMNCFAWIGGLIGDWSPKWIPVVLTEASLLVKSHPEDDTGTMSSL